jgi:hypothetical protein
MKSSGNNWVLDGETITVFIPMTWKRRGGQKVIIAPEGGDALGAGKGAARRDADPCARQGTSVETDVGCVL